ncbi:MAG: hypothetical protein JEY97_04755 [Bacteroidales bacterium]|nr:hypothetical protein [Bacteroidales bacterium]
MSSIRKIDEENYILKYFSKELPDFPKAKLLKTESPDFVICLNSRNKIGIELTKLTNKIPDKNKYGNKIVRSYENKILVKAKQTYESNFKHKFYLAVYFSNSFIINNNQIDLFANVLVQIVYQNTKECNFSSYFSLKIENTDLPKQIEWIRIIHHPEVETSIWKNRPEYLDCEFSKENIQHTIKLKNDKIALYQKKKINTFWLIIIIDYFSNNFSYNIHNKINNWSFDSKFHKVFLFELFCRKIFNLNI